MIKLKYPHGLVLLFTLAITTSLLLAGCTSSEGENNQNRNRSSGNIPAVEAVKARYGSLPLSERLSGTVISNNQVELFPEISGRISEVLVQNGEKVKKGEPLVRLEDSQYREQVQQARSALKVNQAQLKQAKAGLKEIEAQYNRTKTLAEKGLTSKQELETLESQLESARADVELAEAQVEQARSTLQEQKDMLGRTVIHSPIDGTVGLRSAETGMQVNTSTKLFTVGNLSNLRIEVVLTENMLQNIEIGQPARIYVPRGDTVKTISAELDRISPFLNTVTRSTEAEIEVENKENMLRPGMFVAVDILYGESQQATLIPTSALYTDPNTGNEGVFVATSLGSEVEAIEDSSSDGPGSLTQPIDVQFKPVNVLAEGQMEVGVIGVDPGSWIVTIGQDLLSEGRNQARVRTSTWQRILTLQGLQRQDLLNKVLEEQNTSSPTL